MDTSPALEIYAQYVRAKDTLNQFYLIGKRKTMSYAIAISTCGQCGRIFNFNPLYVPSLNNVPFCEECILAANPTRVKKGFKPIIIHPDAYKWCDEAELP